MDPYPGPVVGLPPFPPAVPDVPWPTTEWPRGEWRPGTDVDAVAAHLDRAFDPDSVSVLGDTSAVLVVQGGTIVSERYAPGIDPAATFPSWSMAKSILSAAIGVLVGDGVLALTDTVGWPGWTDPEDRRRELTLRDLLRMKASLVWAEEYSADIPSDVVAMLYGEGASDVAGYVAAKPLLGDPGTIYDYSSGTSNLLAWVFGRVFDHDPDRQLAFLHERIFDPIGMTSALPKFDPTGTWLGSTYCFATAEDFARFGLLLLRGGRWGDDQLVPLAHVDELRTPQADVWDEGWGYGLHAWVRPECGTFFACRGFQAQYVFCAPAHDTIVVRLGVTPETIKKNAAAWTVELLELACP